MPYKDPEKQRAYMREWLRQRRAAFFEGKCCGKCGSTDRLELDHIDPSKKVSHCIWSWSEKRREAEIAKCQVLCHECHLEKSKKDWKKSRSHVRGSDSPFSKLTSVHVQEIRTKAKEGFSQATLARLYGVHKKAIWDIIHNHKWVT